MNIQNFVSQGKIKEAINLVQGNEGVLLMSRLNKLERDIRLDIITHGKANIERNRIIQSVLSYAGSLEVYADTNPAANHVIGVADLINKAKELMIKNKRLDKDIFIAAKGIKAKLVEYQDEKDMSAGYDASGRILDGLHIELKDLQGDEKENTFDKVEDFIEAVNILIEKDIPTWKELKQAYTLCTTKQFNDSWVAQQLELKPDSDEAKAKVATRIELFLNTL